jgi:hypothetical protein
MGKSARKRKANIRKEKKRAAKQAKRALYLSYAGTGKRKKKQNKKSGYTAQRGNHVMLDCGNVGCARCYPQ